MRFFKISQFSNFWIFFLMKKCLLTSRESDANEEFDDMRPTSQGSSPRDAPILTTYTPVSLRNDCNLSLNSWSFSRASFPSFSKWSADSFRDRTRGSHLSKSLFNSLKISIFYLKRYVISEYSMKTWNKISVHFPFEYIKFLHFFTLFR